MNSKAPPTPKSGKRRRAPPDGTDTFGARLRAVGRALYLFGLIYFTAQTMIRRWSIGQVPTQIPDWLVYAVLLANGAMIFRLLKRPPAEASTSTGKN